MSKYKKIKNQYYILANSSLADDRTMVLKDGDSFGVFDRYGDIHPIGQGAQGLYCEGTRFLSKMELLVENQRPLILSSSLREENELLTVDLTNPDFTVGSEIVTQKGTLHIHRIKFVWKNVCYENIRFSNFGLEPLTFSVSLSFSGDFRDIFEVRGIERKARGKRFKARVENNEIVLGYKGLDNIIRRTRVKFENHPNAIHADRAEFQMCLLPKAYEDLSMGMAFEIDSRKPEILSYSKAHDLLIGNIKTMKNNSCDILTNNDQFNEWLVRSKSDMVTMISPTEYGLYPYAGVPWYSTPFGRDGIITAWECLWMDPTLTKGVLFYLAQTQATDFNDFQDAEPGKIFHEKRGGEMAELGEIPFKLYYGTIDATPLFICLAGAYYERTGDLETIKAIWPNIEKALTWIDKYGDLDGDGFVEYAKKSEKGLVNQGWKDSHDSIFYANGDLAQGAIALCEVQGYVYDAKMKAAELSEILGNHDVAARLYKEAAELKEKFAEKFWSEDKKTFALALDGEKKPCHVSTSNAGHCLFSGIVKTEHVEKLSKTLLSEKMFSGWGIRTLASDEVRYNPMSYHDGSVWPHDNAMIAYGLSRYGFHEGALKIMAGLFDLTTFVDAQRLPELFCGFDKRKNEGPTAYPVACAPQAWAVASIYLLLQSCLGLKIVAKKNTIYFYKPTLPDFLNELTITNLKVNDATVILQVRRNINDVTVNVLHKDGEVNIEVINDFPSVVNLEALEKEYKA